MRININFTIDVPNEQLPALRELAAADTTDDARIFVKGTAQDDLIGYLRDNGVGKATVVRDSMETF